ncbi:MAG TPA: hypothetical protein VEV17_25085 [Bryobacteraceae bacterium]|nr:hypothetical protein [Bryobacteraceae bacterium]
MAGNRRWLVLWFGLICVSVSAAAQPDDNAPIPGELPSTQTSDETRFSLALTNETSLVSGAQVPLPAASNIALLQPSFSYKHGQRWRFSSTVIGEVSDNQQADSRLMVREAYAGLSTGDFDWTAGKRILRWGTGYAFSPTGVLDPPRIPTDPTDHLSLNEGRELASLDWTRGSSAVTAVWASAGLLDKHAPGLYDTLALRYNVLYKGLDTAVIFDRDPVRPDLWGVNFTRVFGDGLEVHGEFARRRTGAALVGINYTHSSGWGAIAEYYTAGAGPDWVPAGQDPALAPAVRRHYYFARIAKSRLRELPGWKEWDVFASVVGSFSDQSWAVVAEVDRRINHHVTAYGRALMPGGSPRSLFGAIPFDVFTSLGLKFQL